MGKTMGTKTSGRPTATRRDFSSASLSLLSTALTFGAVLPGNAEAQSAPAGGTSSRRQVLKERLPGEPAREISLVEITYPPGTGSPPHMHANGVAAFVVSGAIASKVGGGPERIFHAGDAWWEPAGAVHRVSRNASYRFIIAPQIPI